MAEFIVGISKIALAAFSSLTMTNDGEVKKGGRQDG